MNVVLFQLAYGILASIIWSLFMVGMVLPFKLGALFAGLVPEKQKWRPLAQKDSGTVATAQTFDFDLPRDRLIWKIMVSIGEDTTATGVQGTLTDDLLTVQMIANGNKTIKDMTAPMAKNVAILNKDVCSTGYYNVYLKDPKIMESRPLPAWIFTSLILRLVDNAPAGSNYHHIRVSILESLERPDLTGWKTLVEKYLTWKKFGNATLWQTYEHERTYDIKGYLYEMDDNGTDSATIFDKLKLIGKSVEREDLLIDELYIAHVVEGNKQEYQTALATGFFSLEMPATLRTRQYTNLYSYLNIPTAGTNAGIRVLERYLL